MERDEDKIARLRTLDRENAVRKTSKYRSLLSHWALRAMRSPEKTEISALPTPTPGQVVVRFVGHASLLIQYTNLKIICDPILGNWRGGVRRERQAGLGFADLEDVDLILISSQNPDHLDLQTLRRLPRTARVIVPQRAAHLVSSLGFAMLTEVGPDQIMMHNGAEIRSTAMRNDGARYSAQGYVVAGDGPSVFFCGSSGYFEGFASIGQIAKPDIAALPIGGYAPMSFRGRHMSPLDALYAFEDLGSKVMIPIRHGSFALSYERLDQPIEWLRELVRDGDLEKYVVSLEPGQSRVFLHPKAKP